MKTSEDSFDKSKPENIENKIREIENRIKKLYNNQDTNSMKLSGNDHPLTPIDMRNSENADRNIEQFLDDNKNRESGRISEKTLAFNSPSVSRTIVKEDNFSIKEKSESLLKTLEEFDNRFENFTGNTKEFQSEERLENQTDSKSESTDLQNEVKLPQQLFDSFYQEKTEKSAEIPDESIVKERLEMIDDQISQIKDGLSSIDTENETSYQDTSYISPQDTIDESDDTIIDRIHEEKEISDKRLNQKHGPIMLRPKAKKAGLFNDVNLTEDYELGFRFYQLGFKTGFFNVKLDDHDESSRIATAEFFPNKFWSSVKQRSRWVAGIVFQNWAAHQWKGNLATKYFLFRDRKSFFSFFGAFLSNILLVYLSVSLVLKALGYYNMYSLVGHSSVLWYLMIANLLFMVSRLSHRFIFTYNWYGLDYAFFSLFRLPLDTMVNFFAIARSVSVYRNTISQKKVVWDSTSHY